MSQDILVGVHGYRKLKGGKDEKPVLIDRVMKTYRVAGRLQNLGLDVGVVFLGGHSVDGNTTAETTRKVASDVESIDVDKFEIFIADQYGGNTQAEIDSFIELTEELEPSMVISVSSRDHTPRILRLWNRMGENVDAEISVVGSDGTYSESELPPFMLEGAAYEPFVEVLDEVFSVDEDKYEEAAEEVKNILQKYQ